MNLSPIYIGGFVKRSFKSEILKRLYVLNRTFAILKFGSFWKLISTSILHQKDWHFKQY